MIAHVACRSQRNVTLVSFKYKDFTLIDLLIYWFIDLFSKNVKSEPFSLRCMKGQEINRVK